MKPISSSMATSTSKIWGSAKPRFIVEKPLNPLWFGGVIGPYFFKNEAGAIVTVKRLHYREMINNFLWMELNNIDLSKVFFQQNGTTCHKQRKISFFYGKS
uniref:Putative LOC100572414 [Acyrthosiphon pisum] n=1 Tax=Lepeophtheirus salmonis TaxID=72036 RepID=A0A0K2V6U2_LEPSM